MVVLVTGSTGHIGSHTAADLMRRGRPVRLLVRDPARVRPALAPLGVDPGAAEVVTGLDPIVHVSTFGALLPAADGPLCTTTPVGRPREPYLASKADAKSVARRHQAEGAPVVITY